jgi:hypothetical protein
MTLSATPSGALPGIRHSLSLRPRSLPTPSPPSPRPSIPSPVSPAVKLPPPGRPFAPPAGSRSCAQTTPRPSTLKWGDFPAANARCGFDAPAPLRAARSRAIPRCPATSMSSAFDSSVPTLSLLASRGTRQVSPPQPARTLLLLPLLWVLVVVALRALREEIRLLPPRLRLRLRVLTSRRNPAT